MKEENVVKKAEPEATVKAKVSSPATEEKDKKAEVLEFEGSKWFYTWWNITRFYFYFCWEEGNLEELTKAFVFAGN